MTVKRIVLNIATGSPQKAAAFYGDVLGLDKAMDLGWIATYAGEGTARAQVSFATEGGSGTDVPDISIEVDDLDATHDKLIAAGFPILYGPVNEPWGVRRLFTRDPFNRLVNILVHE
ncbi:MAG: glyoxalase [Sneathiella sp.]|jgi:catechol 2,3-dioxygenase-like lactoylglutathione lyase family enzyme|uniref:VOC family protein n=1 Tax=Sneathiella sp. TaxID=1964365 RepID=UPI000C466594|nr:VOC family protein [Sneathiella sp.]MAL79325.1 glyoxalase [Sneathiella sp.]